MGNSSNKHIYHHKISQQSVDCPHIWHSKKASKCPIYHAVKEKYQYTKDNLAHLQQYKHFKNEYEQKPKCKYDDECKSYIRCEQGQDENSISDKCHMMIYRHPPRTRQIKLAENIHSLILNESQGWNYGLFEPFYADKQKLGWKWDDKYHEWQNPYPKEDGWLRALISEVIDNGYSYDLCMKCKKDDECKHDVYNSQYYILHIVDEKNEL